MSASERNSGSRIARAQQSVAISDEECEFMRDYLDYPSYYCECLNHGLPFHYGMDTIIQGLNWYTATLNQVAAGFSAYWFSTASVSLNAYISCGQDTATMSMVVGANRSYHADIQTLLNRFGGNASAFEGIPLHVCAQQPDYQYGRLIITPYDKGPHSTCEDPLPLIANNPYVVSDSDNVYMLTPAWPSAQGQIVRWCCEGGQPATISISRGSCDAAPIMSHTLTDSLHVWMVPADLLTDARRVNDTLYFHCSTQASLAEAWYLKNLVIQADTIDSTACLGAILDINGLKCHADTVFSDTIYMLRDTVHYLPDSTVNPTYGKHLLRATTYRLHFTAPELEYDTIRCHADSLGFYYLGLRSQRINSFGDFSVYYNVRGECQRDIRLHVEEILYPQTIEVDSTLCQGRRIRLNGVNYTKDTVFSVSTWQGKQEIITTYRLHFTAPVLDYDTIYCHYDSLPFNYRSNTACKVTKFGKQTFTIVDPSYKNCTEKVQLTVSQLWYEQRYDVDTTICRGAAFSLAGATRLSDTLYLKQTQDKQTKYETYYHISFSDPELEYDSLLLHISRMPYSYYGVEIPSYGDTTVYVYGNGTCDRLVSLHVEEYIHPITYDSARIDTTFCTGMTFTLHGKEYHETMQFVDTFWTSEYSVLYTTCSLSVLPIITEYDTVRLLASSMPYTYYDSLLTSFGSYTIDLQQEGTCERLIYLELVEKPVYYDTTRVDTSFCKGTYLSLADSLIFTETDFVRVRWSAGLDSCFTTLYHVAVSELSAISDTIHAYYSELPYHYAAYPGGKNLSAFGEYSFPYRPVGDCEQVYNVNIIQIWDRDTVVSNDTICAGGKESHTYEQIPANISRSDSVHLNIYNIYVATPHEWADTLTVSSDSLPAIYEGNTLVEEGDYDLTIRDADGCESIVHLHMIVVPAKHEDALYDITLPNTQSEPLKFVREGRLYIYFRGQVYDSTGRLIIK